MSVQGARLVTLILAGTCAVLFLLALALQFGLGRSYHWLADDENGAAPAVDGVIDRTPFKLPPETTFAEIAARPIFNEDRKPTPETTVEAPPPPPPTPLNINLTGVILTPQLRMAMIHDNAKNDSAAVKEGMPLPGDLGGWTLTQVKPRSAVFKEAGGDEVEVELMTAVANPKPGTPGHPGSPPAPPVAGAAGGARGAAPPPNAAKPNGQAEDLQRRIEERRRQMRDEAERLKQQQQQQNPQQH
ncbi:MAG TPA: hypothetical protein VFB32_05135 [Rudaea sp.]|nr:hypothetical protein [Rudaea sp.]